MIYNILFIIVYLIGFFITYRECKKMRDLAKANDWSYVFATIILSIFSWIGVVAMQVIKLSIRRYKTKTKPPRYL